MSRRVLLCLLAAASAVVFVLMPTGSALAGNPNAGDVWVDNVGQPAGPGHEMDPHLACQDINLWGAGLADSSGSYTIDGWPPSGGQERDYGPRKWSYDQSKGGTQILDVISVKTLIENAIANGDAPQNGQGFHFKLEFSQDPQKHKTFWVNCGLPSIATHAASATAGQPIHDTAMLTGGNSPTGQITWHLYSATDTACKKSLETVVDPVNGDGGYASPGLIMPIGSYQWVATYSGDSHNLTVSTKCNDPNEESTVSQATPSIATTATSAMAGQPIHDVAYLTGGDAPTGTITWNVYAAGPACTAPPLYTTAPVAVNGDGTYRSPDFSPGTGSYQWVATYSGDANNHGTSTSCNDPQEQSVVQAAPAPAISLVKLERDASSGGAFTHGPITGNPGERIDYQMTVVDTGNTPLVISFSDPQCDAGTLSAPAVLSGTFDAATSRLSAGGELQYTCSHVLAAADAPAYTNTASVSGQAPNGQSVSAQDSVKALVNIAPGLTVVKLQRDGSSGAFTSGTITARVGDTIEYEIQATNTGNVPLTLSLSDPRCDAGTVAGPMPVSGTLTGNVLAPGATAQYTCSHVLGTGDAPSFTNVGTITGQPPSGPALSGTGVVTANVTNPGIRVIKLQRAGTRGAFTTRTITAKVGSRIQYEIRVINTGSSPLMLRFSDPRCNAGTIAGPHVLTGTLSGDTLSPGGEVQYTCSHVLRAYDASPFTNTVTVIGQPPSGPPVLGTSSVTVKKAAVQAKKILRCRRGMVRKVERRHGKKIIVCVRKQAVHAIRIRRHALPPQFTG